MADSIRVRPAEKIHGENNRSGEVRLGPISGFQGGSNSLKWRAPSERIRTALEIPVEMELTDADAIPVYMKISEKVLHLRRLGMSYASIADHLGVNLWMAKKAAR
ncbi:MAG: hypothetical protein WAV26_00450 [Candidatus Deferrimicrobium sp.]